MTDRIVGGRHALALALTTLVGGAVAALGCSAMTSFDNFVGDGTSTSSSTSSTTSSSGSNPDASSSSSSSTSSSGSSSGDGGASSSSSGDAQTQPCTVKQTPQKNATVVAQNGGDESWFNPEGAYTVDNTFASVPLQVNTKEQSHFLRLTKFDFQLPPSAEIRGIRATVTWYSSGADMRDEQAKLVINGALAGLNRAKNEDLPNSTGTESYGDESDRWGNTGLTAAEVNSELFGVGLQLEYHGDGSATGFVDAITLQITYCSVD